MSGWGKTQSHMMMIVHMQNSVYKAPRFSIGCQGFTEDQDKEKDKDSQDH